MNLRFRYHYGRPLQQVWSTEPDLTPYTAITPAQSLRELNAPGAVGARESSRLDFASADRINDDAFNRLLWRIIKGETPYPGSRRSSTLDYARNR